MGHMMHTMGAGRYFSGWRKCPADEGGAGEVLASDGRERGRGRERERGRGMLTFLGPTIADSSQTAVI